MVGAVKASVGRCMGKRNVARPLSRIYSAFKKKILIPAMAWTIPKMIMPSETNPLHEGKWGGVTLCAVGVVEAARKAGGAGVEVRVGLRNGYRFQLWKF